MFSLRLAGKVNSSKNRLAKEVTAKYLRMADAAGKMRIEKIVNDNKNKKKPRKFGYINCVTKTYFLTKQNVYNVVRTTTTKKD